MAGTGPRWHGGDWAAPAWLELRMGIEMENEKENPRIEDLEKSDESFDGRKRCGYVNLKNPRYVEYHDREWCTPCHDDAKLYEMFVLELFQAGLSWEILLNKRENFRAAYSGFDVDVVAGYGEQDVEHLMSDPGIVRNRAKIVASIGNSRVFQDISREFGSFDAYIWGFTGGKTIYEDPPVTKDALSDSVSKDLKKRGVKFAGSVTIFSYLQAIGVINSHEKDCFRYGELSGLSGEVHHDGE